MSTGTCTDCSRDLVTEDICYCQVVRKPRGKKRKRGIVDVFSYVDSNLNAEPVNTDYHGEAPRYTDAHYAAVMKASGPIAPETRVLPKFPPGDPRNKSAP